MAKRRHLRLGDSLDNDDIVVVRGGELEAEITRSDAVRHHDVYGVFGVSVFAARGITVDELAQQPPLVRFEVLTLVRVGVLRAAGFCWLGPTGRQPAPLHARVDDLDSGVRRLTECEHLRWENPYHED